MSDEKQGMLCNLEACACVRMQALPDRRLYNYLIATVR